VEIARGSSAWMRLKGWLGKGLQQLGRWLSTSLDNHRKDKISATTKVATEQISNAQTTLASNASQKVTL
jgi:hypothetical protein